MYCTAIDFILFLTILLLKEVIMSYKKINTKTGIFAIFGRIYRLLRVSLQLSYGILQLSRATIPMVTIFGGSRMLKTNHAFAQASDLAEMLVNHNISVISGGGTGIMEAANCGAKHKRKTDAKSIGIGVKNLDKDKNQCVDIYLSFDYFFAKKWLLINYSHAFIFFPGGYGTLDEFFEVLTLMQTFNLSRVPMVLVGTDFWQPLISWMYDESSKSKLIIKEELRFFVLTDDIQEAFSIVTNHCFGSK